MFLLTLVISVDAVLTSVVLQNVKLLFMFSLCSILTDTNLSGVVYCLLCIFQTAVSFRQRSALAKVTVLPDHHKSDINL